MQTILTEMANEESQPLHPTMSTWSISSTGEAPSATDTIPLGSLSSFLMRPLTTRETAIEAMKFFFLWFLANYFSNAALQYTNVASFTILSSMSGFFTLFLGACTHVETFTWLKLAALFISFHLDFEQTLIFRISGVVLVSIQDSDQITRAASHGNLALLGDFIALLGAALYSCYTTLLKLRIHHENRVDMPLFLGFVGIYCLITLFPFIFILSILGIEPFEWPQSSSLTFCILVMRSLFRRL